MICLCWTAIICQSPRRPQLPDYLTGWSSVVRGGQVVGAALYVAEAEIEALGGDHELQAALEVKAGRDRQGELRAVSAFYRSAGEGLKSRHLREFVKLLTPV